MYLFLDTETTGKNPNVSRSVQIAWLLTDTAGRTTSEASCIIRPDGFHIPADSTRIHGITNESAIKKGAPLREVLLKV